MNAANHELRIEYHVACANPQHEGHRWVRTLAEHFEEKGPHGTHLCLGYEPMREPLWLFQTRCRNRRFPLGLLKGYIKLLLKGLDYLHSECNIIHTGKYICYPTLSLFYLQCAHTSADLKLDNILVSFEKESVVEDFAIAQSSNPMPRKVNGGHTVFLSHNDFGPLRSYYILPKITDFGLAHHQNDSPVLNRHPVQPDGYRAPEVILGAGWTYSVDIWNLGLLVRILYLVH